MKKRWRASTALLFLVCGTLSSFLLIDILVFWDHSVNFKKSFIKSNIQAVEILTQLQQQTMDNAQGLLETIAELPTIREGNVEKITTLFKHLDKSQPNYNGFNLFTLEGKTVASIYRGRVARHLRPEIVVNRKYFKDALTNKSFSVGTYLIASGIAQIDNLPIATPVYDENNQLKYILMASINIEKITSYFLRVATNSQKYIQMYDSNKTLIYTTDGKNRHLIGSTAKAEHVADLIKSSNISVWEESRDLEGNKIISSLAILKLNNSIDPYMYFLVSSNPYSLLYLIKDIYFLEILGLFFALIISILLAYWTEYHYFSQGLDKLTYVATSAQNGNFSIRNLGIPACYELQVLGKAFDTMLKNLESSTTHLQEQKSRLDFALNGAKVATWEWNTQNRKYLLDRRGINLLGYNNVNNFIDLGSLMQKYDLQQAQITMDKHVEDKIASFEYEVKLVHQNGGQVWFFLQGRKEITTHIHNVQRIFGICIDITQRKKLERFETERAEYFKRLSHRDALTGLSNRRHFMEQAQVIVQHSLRHKHVFSVGMLDLDFFKKINDTYGHVVGDQVLKALSNLMVSIVRKTDIIGRYGGEEFIFLLPETDQDKSISAAEKLRKSIMDLVVSENGQDITFTASIGICTYTPKYTAFNSEEQISSIIVELTSCADNNLYNAKQSGRNKVVSTNYVDVSDDTN